MLHLGAQRVAGVLDHPGQRGDRLRFADALAHEQRCDQVVDPQVRFGDELAHRPRAAETARTCNGTGRSCTLSSLTVRPSPPTRRAVGALTIAEARVHALPRGCRSEPVACASCRSRLGSPTNNIDVAPGETVTLPLTVHNLGESTESYTVVPAGLSASWTTVRRGNLTLFGGSQDVLDVEITPPLLPTTTAGPTEIAVRIIPTSTDDDAIVAEATLGDPAVRRLPNRHPPARAAGAPSRHVRVHGREPRQQRHQRAAPADRPDEPRRRIVRPPAVGVAPGASSLVRLKVHDSPWTFRRHTRTLDFEVEAQRQGLPPAVAPLALVQPPTIPGRAIATILGVAALLAAAVLRLVRAGETVDRRRREHRGRRTHGRIGSHATVATVGVVATTVAPAADTPAVGESR